MDSQEVCFFRFKTETFQRLILIFRSQSASDILTRIMCGVGCSGAVTFLKVFFFIFILQGSEVKSGLKTKQNSALSWW